MSGCWVIWPADITIRADVSDIAFYLTQGVATLCEHPDIDEADYEYDAGTTTVRFILRVRYGISEIFVRRQALDALNECLPAIGLATSQQRVMSPIAWLQFTRWPSDFRWWRR